MLFHVSIMQFKTHQISFLKFRGRFEKNKNEMKIQ